MADLNVKLILRLVDRATAPARDAIRAIERQGGEGLLRQADRLSAAGARAQRFARDQLQLTRDQLEASRQRTMGLYGEAAAVAAQGWAFAQMLRPAIAFEAKMAEVGKVVDFESKTGLTDLGNDIQKLVTSGGLPMVADGIADIIASASQANLIDAALPDAEKRKQLIEFAEAAGKMGIAFDISAEAAGQAMATWRSQLGLTQAETMKLGDAVNFLSNNMNASAADVTDIIGRQGGFAKVAGLTTTEIAALATAFRTAAPSSEVAATAMKNFTATLVAGEAMTDRQAAIMKRLGFDATELAQRMRVDAKGSIIEVMEALKQLPEHEQAANLRQLFGDEAVGAVAPLLENLDNLRRAFELVGDEASYAGAMQAEYEGVAATTSAKLVVFRNYLTRLSVSLMPLLSMITDVTEALQPMLERMGEWMQANPEIIKWIGMGVAGLLALKVGVLGLQMIVQPLIGAYWLFNGALAVGIRIYGLALRGIAGLLRVLVALRSALPMVARAVALLGRALLANPIGLAVAAIAAAVFLIYRNWEDVGPWFRRLWDNVRSYFAGFSEFVLGIFTLDFGRAWDGLKQMWSAATGFFQTIWDGIEGVFTAAWDRGIAPVLDKLGLLAPITAAWEAFKEAIGVVIDWLSAKFTALMAVIKPVLDGLKWVQANGASAANSVTGGYKGPISSGPYTGGATQPILPPAAVPGVTVPGRALGGPVRAGQIYRWQEEGHELFVPRSDGQVISNRQLRAMQAMAEAPAGLRVVQSAPSSGAVRSTSGRAMRLDLGGITINAAPGMDAQAVARAVRREFEALTRDRGFALHDGGDYA